MPHLLLLSEIGRIVSEARTLQEVLDRVTRLVAARMQTDVCSIYLIGADMTELTLSATIGLNRESVGRVHLPVGEGLVGLAAKLRKPVVTDNAEAHPSYKYFPETGE